MLLGANVIGYPDRVPFRKMVKSFLTTEVWAQLWLCSEDCTRIKDLLASANVVKRSSVLSRLHITVYHARRPMPGLNPTNESISLIVPTCETRFMVLAPGGENPRPELIPADRKVGIRIQKQSPARPDIETFRDRLLKYETRSVLGRRAPSTRVRNAFGARNFQPHMSLLRAGSGIDHDLKKVGAFFRREIGLLRFDRFSIELARKERPGPSTH
jgi:hypothetical protein